MEMLGYMADVERGRPESGDEAGPEQPLVGANGSDSPGSAETTEFVRWVDGERGVTRVFTGGDGREWMVRELPPPSYDRRRGPSLLFSADDVWRRVRRYPADWQERTDAELYTLSLGV